MTFILLLSATVLGLLAFFEPCTIATHTLFTVRAHRQTPKKCCHALMSVWLTRSVLCAGILVLLVSLINAPVWGSFIPSIILATMAIIYLLSRKFYIPVPHLTFYHLLPKGKHLPEGVKLGLTLPACTLPLFLIVAGVSVTYGSIFYALVAGILFATFFTIPMVIASLKGLSDQGQDLLQKAAKGSPYLTAVLLFAAALFLMLSEFDLNAENLTSIMTEASWAGIGLAFLAGFAFSFNPVSFASIPVVLAYVTKAHEKKQAIYLGLTFVMGLITTHVILGVAAALGGEWVKSIMGREWGLVLGPLLILLGFIWAGWIKLRLPWMSMRAKIVTGYGGAFLLAIPFSIAVCPFCTPALLVVLTASAAVGSVAFGFALLLAFSIGRSIPIILGAWSMGWLESLRGLSRYQRTLEIVGGLVLVATGLYLLNEYFFIL